VNILQLKWIATAVAFGCLALQSPGIAATQDKPTADQAKNSSGDLQTMKKIRKAVMDDKTLSTSAHNVKIISQAGKVTLKGPVKTEEEKTTIVKLATDVAGEGNVTDQITVTPPKPKKGSN
jgi:hyperosmotically inducible periplasmic protein